MQRDMCGKLLMLSMKNKIDMKLVFKFPLSIVSLVFGKTDGTMNHTPKATLINAFAGKSATHPPRHIDAYVIDGFSSCTFSLQYYPEFMKISSDFF